MTCPNCEEEKCSYDVESSEFKCPSCGYEYQEHMNNIDNIISDWVFMSECPIPKGIKNITAASETPLKAYKTVRDVAIFTNQRIIFQDTKGMGKKKEVLSVPYSSIDMWSTENATGLDFSATLTLWLRQGKLEVKIGRGINVHDIDRAIASFV